MSKKHDGPFKRKSTKRKKNFSIHAPWAGAALALIVITQLPISIKASLDIFCITQSNNRANPHWCNHF